jgi:hypothetical protein
MRSWVQVLETASCRKCRERLRTEDLKWLDLFPDPAQVRATCMGLPFIAIAAARWCKVMDYLNPYCNYSFFGSTSSSEGMYKVIRPAVGEASRYLILPFSYNFSKFCFLNNFEQSIGVSFDLTISDQFTFKPIIVLYKGRCLWLSLKASIGRSHPLTKLVKVGKKSMVRHPSR